MAQTPNTSFPIDNVARSLTYAFATLYQLGSAQPGQPLNGVSATTTIEVLTAFTQRSAQLLASNANFLALSDREKQEYSETLLFMPTFALLTYVAGYDKGDVERQQQAVTLARTNFKTLFGAFPEEFDLK